MFGARRTHTHELERGSGEEESISRPKPRDERFLDGPECLAAKVLHRDLCVADDCADRHPVSTRKLAVVEDVSSVLELHPRILGIRRQRLAASADEVECPPPLFVGEPGVRTRGAHFLQQLLGREAAAECNGNEMLREDVERTLDLHPRFDGA